MAIPKVIHYCWFGGVPLPKEYNEYIQNWKIILPEYKFIRWDETNCDLEANAYVKEAYNKGKWAFVSDYFRLKALYEYGGIYLDTDVELFKSFNPLLKNKFFCGYIFDCLIGTAVIGAEKESSVIKSLLKKYEKMNYVNPIPNNHQFTDYFLKLEWFKLNGKRIEHDGILILPKESFEVPPIFGKGYSEHHTAGSWKDNDSDGTIKKLIKIVLPHNLLRQAAAYKGLKNNEYYKIYKTQRKK